MNNNLETLAVKDMNAFDRNVLKLTHDEFLKKCDQHDQEVVMVFIEPEMASELLMRNRDNRPLNRATVSFLAQNLRDKEWLPNPQPIMLNRYRLIDGQHRLAACVQANIGFVTALATGVPDDVFKAIDQHRPRGGADIFSIEGIAHSQTAAAVVNGLFSYDSPGSTKISNTLKLKLYYKYGQKSIDEAVTSGHNLYRNSKILTKQIYAIFYFLFSSVDGDKCEEFFEQLSLGTGLEKDSPVFILRKKLLENIMEDKKYDKRHKFALIIKAWNFFIADKIVTRLTWNRSGSCPESFPKITGLTFNNRPFITDD